MSDTNPAPAGQEPSGATEGLEPADTPTPDIPSAATDKDGIESLPEWAQKAIKDLRSENASHRKKVQETERAAEAQRLAEMSEIERVREEAKNAATERDALIADLRRERVLATARSKNAVDPEAVYALINKDSLQWNGAQSANLDAAIDALLTAKSYLVAPASPVAPVVTPPSPGRQSTQHGASRPPQGGYRL